ncbi:MAG: MFS transporter [Actinobacteria bacterium]|nr:MFS transporter [Actinomycetota bacterium]
MVPSWLLLPPEFDERHRKVLLLVGLGSMLVAFTNTLFTQTVAFAADEFGVSNSAQGLGSAIVRWGIVISLPIVARADARGRRPMIVALSWAAPLVCALGALSPNFAVLVATQTLGRPLGLTLDILLAVLVIEEMPRDSRAYATGLLAVLSGLGAGVAVASLPLADISLSSWRWIYVMSLVWLPVALAITRGLPESIRFVARRTDFMGHARGFSRTGLTRNLGRICSVVFLTNIFIATMSIFQNRYLKDTRGYSALLVALFTTATSSPAAIGLVIGGRVADARGRRRLGAFMVPVGAALLALSFAAHGPVMWWLAISGAVGLGLAYPAMAVYRGELFPTHQRGLAGGLIMTSSLVGGSIGLIGAGRAVDAGASYGSVMLTLLVFPVLASVVVWMRYPETAHRALEDINPEDAATSTIR